MFKLDKTFIIAEAGVNHNGRLDLALKLADAAKASGADAVKFQNFRIEALIRKTAPKAAYQTRNIGGEKTQYQMLKELELSDGDTRAIQEHCGKIGIMFLSTPYDFESIELLESLDVPVYKLASIDAVCHPLIKKIASTGKPLILSTGMTTEEEILSAVEAWKSAGGQIENLILLQCTTDYPAKPEEQNLLAMNILKKYAPNVGFSDHTQGLEISLAAVALGARVIERHFTLDRSLPGPDQRSSLEIQDMKLLVSSIRRVEQALGKELKTPSAGERENLTGMRRSICASRDLAAGTVITEQDLLYKRPGDGLFPTTENIQKLIGKKTTVAIMADENITLDKII